MRKRAQAKDKESLTVLPVMEQALTLLQDGKPCRVMLKGIAAEDLKMLQGLNLLTAHPVLYVCNVAEADAATGNEHTKAVEAMATKQGASVVIISAAIEAEVAQLPDDEEMEFLADLGLTEPGLDKLIRAGMTYMDAPGGGAVFSTGSITFCGSLSHTGYDNNVSRILFNVLNRFGRLKLNWPF